MTKFNIGDRVLKDLYTDGSHYGCHDGKEAIVAEIQSDSAIYVDCTPYDKRYLVHPDGLKLLTEKERIIQDIKTGDILVDDGRKYKVLARVEDIVSLSYADNFTEANNWYTIEELERTGYKLKQDEPEVKELTVAEVEEKLGHKVKIVKDNK